MSVYAFMQHESHMSVKGECPGGVAATGTGPLPIETADSSGAIGRACRGEGLRRVSLAVRLPDRVAQRLEGEVHRPQHGEEAGGTEGSDDQGGGDGTQEGAPFGGHGLSPGALQSRSTRTKHRPATAVTARVTRVTSFMGESPGSRGAFPGRAVGQRLPAVRRESDGSWNLSGSGWGDRRRLGSQGSWDAACLLSGNA